MEQPGDLPALEAEGPTRGRTIIRVKRKRNEEPLDALVIVGLMPPSKRAAFDALSSAFASLSTKGGAPPSVRQAEQPQTTRRLYRLAHTAKSTRDDETKTALDRIEDIKQKRKRTLEVDKEEKSKHTAQQKKEQTRTARLKVVERHRTKAGTIVDVASVDQEKPAQARRPPPAIRPAAAVTRKLPSARRQGPPRFTPNLAAAKTQEQVRESEQRKRAQAAGAGTDEEAALGRFLPMVKSYLAEVKGKEKLMDEDEDEEYEYDLYYFDDTADRSELEREREYGVIHIESFDEDLVPANEYDESEDEYDSEDSNDENNPNNEYPEETSSDEEPEEALSEISSDDERQLSMFYYRQQQEEEYTQYAYEEGLRTVDGDDDDVLEDDDDYDDGDDEGGIVPPPMIQPDFAFFQSWRAMRK